MNRIFKFQNASQWPSVYDFEFLCPGLVNYKDIKCGICNLDKEVIDAMLPSFVGKPVTIGHVKATPAELEKITNGNVISTYFDAASGKFRVKFLVTTDEAHQKIKDGWKVSCAYDVLALDRTGGRRHAVPYDQDILKGTFTHLAICKPDEARYEDSTGGPVDDGMLVFNNSMGEALLLKDKPTQEANSMFKFKFHFPVTVEKLENSVDPEKTFVEVSAGKKVSVKDLIAAFNSKAVVTDKSEEVSEDSVLEIVNSTGETVKVTVKDLVEAFNASDAEAAKAKEAEDKENKELENSMSDDEKKEYAKADDMGKCSMRKNMKERKNAQEKEEKEKAEKETRENAIKVKQQEEARSESQKNLKTFTLINSKGKAIPDVVAGTKDDGSLKSGLERGNEYFGQKFGKKK